MDKNNGIYLKGLSLFSNVGVAETYLKDIGIEIVVANEKEEDRARFYKHLYPSTDMVCGDITESSIRNEIVEKSKSKGVEFIIATPPCQGMSCAGKQDPLDPRNKLITYAIEVIERLNPKFVLLENVPMQLKTYIQHKDNKILIPQYIKERLSSKYNFNENTLINAKDYGVPQSRQRSIFLLTRKDINYIWEFPKPDDSIITLKHAIGNLPSLDPYIRQKDERWRFPDYERKRIEGEKVSKWHYPPTHSWHHVEWMMHTRTGTSAFKNKIYYPKKDGRIIKGAPRTYMRMDWNKVAPTVLQTSGVISTFTTVHPGRVIYDNGVDEDSRLYSDARTLTIYELLIVSSLPKNWDIPEWASDKLIRSVIGEGIPPLLIKKIVKNMIDNIN